VAERGDIRAAAPDLPRRIERMRQAGRVVEAEAACRAALTSAPDDAEIHHQLGRVLLDQGRNAEAEACFRRAIRQAPRLAAAHAELGRALWQSNRHDDAVAACRRAIAIDPRHGRAHNMLGHVLRTLGDFAAAEAVLRQAIAIAPGTADPHSNLGLLYADQGRRDEAIACFEQALAAEPESAAAHYYLSLHKPVAPGDPRVAAMLDLLATRRFTPEARCFLLFALGRAFDRLGEYDRAFGYLAEANRSRRKMFEFDIDAEIQAVERVIAAFPAARLAETIGCADALPIFVAGLPRSGKSLIEGLLTRHPRARGAGESYAMIRIALQLPKRLGSDRPFPECVATLDPPRARGLGAEYVAELRRRLPEAARTVDTRPSNLRLAGLIRLLLPRARVILCRRDPRDLGLQCYFQNYSGLAYSFDLEEMAKFTLANDRLMAHWRAAMPDWILEVRYEDLVRDPAAESRRIYAFCGLDWDAAFPGRGAAFPVSLHDAEIGHWRRYARQLEPLIAALAAGGVAP